MKTSWRTTFRRLAAGCAVSGAMAWSSAMCYAVQVAHDIATNNAYLDTDGNNTNDGNPANNTNGWVEGDNGGTGFGVWNFDTTYTTPVQQKMDASSPFNQLGRSWTKFNVTDGGGGDISQSGRSIPTLQVGQTVTVLFDTPDEAMFNRGFTVKFNNGTSNGCYAGDNCSTPAYDPGSIANRAGVGIFGWLHPDTIGRYHLFTPDPDGWPPGPNPAGHRPLTVQDTDQGVRLDFTLTAAESYTLVMDPTEAGVPTYTHSGTLDPGEMNENIGKPINWIEFEFYNTATSPGYATDWYIRSIEITAPDPVGEPGDFNDDGIVNAADYVTWRKNTANNALPNDDGLTTQAARFNLWRGNFGNGAGAGGGHGGGGAVPEPGTFVYLVTAAVGGSALGLRRRR